MAGRHPREFTSANPPESCVICETVQKTAKLVRSNIAVRTCHSGSSSNSVSDNGESLTERIG